MPGLFGIRVSRCRHGRWVAAITFYAADLPEDVVALVDAHLLDLGGTYGVPEAGDPIQYDELRIEHERAVKCRTAVRSMGPVVATSLLLVLVGIVLGGGLGGLLLLVLLVVVVKVAGLPHRRSPFRYITSVSRFLMRNMNGQLSLMGARSDKSALQAARVRGLAAGNRCHRPGSPVFRHRSIIHSHLSARSMRPSSLMPSRIESGATAEAYRPAEYPTLRVASRACGPRAYGCLGGRASRGGRESRNPSATYQSQRNGASVCAGGPWGSSWKVEPGARRRAWPCRPS